MPPSMPLSGRTTPVLRRSGSHMIQSADAESTGGGPSSRSPPLVHDQDIDSEFGEETSGEGPGETGSDDEDLSHPLASHHQVRRPRSSIKSVLCGMGLHLGEDRRIMKGHCRPTSDRSGPSRLGIGVVASQATRSRASSNLRSRSTSNRFRICQSRRRRAYRSRGDRGHRRSGSTI